MKKTLLLCALLAQTCLLSAQIYVEGVQIGPDNTGQYIELDPEFKTTGRCNFIVDYGQANNRREDFVTNEKGERYDFRSLVDGLNIFYINGWEVAQVFGAGADNSRRYLLKRRF